MANRFKTYSTKKMSTLTPGSDAKCSKTRKNISTLDEYLDKVRNIIGCVITENKFGINIDKLYQLLSAKLGFNFDVRLFQCKDFYEFLINFCENFVDIEIKRNFSGGNRITLMIYPKNFRFGPNKFIDPSKLDAKRQNSIPQQPQNNNAQANLNLHSAPFHFANDPKSQFHHKKGEVDSMSELPHSMNRVVPQPNYAGLISQPFGHNPFLHHPGFPQQNRNKSTSSSATITNQNIIQFSPIIFYGDNEDIFTQSPDKQGQAHNRSISYCNLNFGPNDQPNNIGNGITLISNINTVIHSRNESKNTAKVPEESNAEINENLRFIEELLKDGDDVNFNMEKDGSNFDLKSPNLSMTSIRTSDHQNFIKNTHSKTYSEDYNLPTHTNSKAHGRFSSIVNFTGFDKDLTSNVN